MITSKREPLEPAAKLRAISTQLTDLDDQPLEIGMPFEMVSRRLSLDRDERGTLVYG